MLTNTTVVLSHNYTLEASFRSSALRSTQAQVWANMLAKSTTKLSDLLVGFNVNICVNGEASLKKALKFREIYSWSNSNIIGLRIPSYSQLFFSLQVVGPFPVVGYLHWKTQLLVNISYTSLMMGQNPETSLKLDS